MSTLTPPEIETLRAKYRAERDRRIRPDGGGQYRAASGGFGGLQTGAGLRQAGLQDLGMVDEAGDFGGTWYWNRYPGIHCDIEATV